jgi:hypothetical protein
MLQDSRGTANNIIKKNLIVLVGWCGFRRYSSFNAGISRDGDAYYINHRSGVCLDIRAEMRDLQPGRASKRAVFNQTRIIDPGG